MPDNVVDLVDADRALVMRALRSPRGRYGAERAGQLSGVPSRTLYDWAKAGVLVPDWFAALPRGWSYRDIVFARALAWLRHRGLERPVAAKQLELLRTRITDGAIDPLIRTDGAVVLLGESNVDELSGQQVFDGIVGLLDVFELTEPIEGVSTREIRGPNLVRPSIHTHISPWVVGGEPCVDASRITSASLYALHTDRGLVTEQVLELYPQLSREPIDDAIELEVELRAA